MAPGQEDEMTDRKMDSLARTYRETYMAWPLAHLILLLGELFRKPSQDSDASVVR